LRLHQRAATRHQADRVGQRKHASEGSGDELADTVPDHRRRLHAKAHPPARERVFDGEGRRLHDRGRQQRIGIVAEQAFAKIDGKLALHRRKTRVQRLAKRRFGGIQRLAHAGVLRALPREHEYHLARMRRTAAGNRRSGFGALQLRHCLCVVVCNHAHPMRERLATDRQGPGDIGKIEIRVRLKMRGEALCSGSQRCRGACRQQQ